MIPIEPPKIDPLSIKKILLVRLRRIGDIVMTTPALVAVRQAFPEAHISYIIEEPYKELLEGHPYLNELIVLPKGQKTLQFFRFILNIRRGKYDLVIDFHGGPRASLISFLSKAQWKIGYRVKYKHFIYDIKLPRQPEYGHIHSVENHVNLVKALGCEIGEISPLKLPPTRPQDQEKVLKLMTGFLGDEKKLILLHIGAGNEFRDWGREKLTELINLFSQIPGIAFALIGTDEDKAREDKILKETAQSVLPLVGKLNLRELREVIARSNLFIGPDSGPMHIAASTNTPIVAIFGPTLPANFSPWQAQAKVVEKKLDCRPCRQIKCIYSDFRCLQTISPQEVFREGLKFLQCPGRTSPEIF